MFELLKKSSSPYINRFLSADTIVPSYAHPQSLNRYAYTLNNPVRYTDPTGHMVDAGGGGGTCNKKCLQSLNKGKDKGKRDDADWEKQVLRNLKNMGGPEGVHAVDYISQNDVHLVLKPERQPAAWHLLSNDIFLDSRRYNEKNNPADPYMLSLIAHEATHLEQRPLKAITVAGEVEAWQVGFTVYKNMTGNYPGDLNAANNIMTLDAQNMSASDLQNARQWMTDFDPGYRSDLLLPWSQQVTFNVFFTYNPPLAYP